MNNEKKSIKWYYVVIGILLIAIIALIIFLVINSNKETSVVSTNMDKNISSTNTATNNISKTVQKQETKKYGLNEEVTITTSNEIYTLTITGITEMSERNRFSDKNPSQVFLIDYSYKNIKSNDELYISDSNFTIVDETGVVGDSYPNSRTDYPQRISEGTKCNAQMVLCVNNASSKIELRYKDNMFSKNTDVIFEIEL